VAGDFAAELRRIAGAVARDGAKAAADGAANKFVELTLPHVPVRSGALRRSIRVKGGGGGIISTASAAPHTVYAAIQNYGGIIRVKHTYTTKARKVSYTTKRGTRVSYTTRGGKTMPGWLSDGKTFFGHSVKIPGKGYWTLAGKEGAIDAAARQAIKNIIDGAA